MGLEGAKRERGSGQEWPRLAKAKKERHAEQQKDAKLPGHQAGQRGREKIAEEMEAAGGASIQKPENPDGDRKPGQQGQQPENEAGLGAHQAERIGQKEATGGLRIISRGSPGSRPALSSRLRTARKS